MCIAQDTTKGAFYLESFYSSYYTVFDSIYCIPLCFPAVLCLSLLTIWRLFSLKYGHVVMTCHTLKALSLMVTETESLNNEESVQSYYAAVYLDTLIT
jgi:hypothetical protein